MFYILYLSSLCRRRRWSDPHYECQKYQGGYICSVRVNNREYQGDTAFATEVLAQENAAMRAYLICRNISVHENMYPQGLPNMQNSFMGGMAGMSGGLLVNGMGSQGM